MWESIKFSMREYEWEFSYDGSYEFCLSYRVNGGYTSIGRVEPVKGIGLDDIRSNMDEKDLALLKLRQLKGEEGLLYAKDGIDLYVKKEKGYMNYEFASGVLHYGGKEFNAYVGVVCDSVSFFFRKGDSVYNVVLWLWTERGGRGFEFLSSLHTYSLKSNGEECIEDEEHLVEEGLPVREDVERFIDDEDLWLKVKKVGKL